MSALLTDDSSEKDVGSVEDQLMEQAIRDLLADRLKRRGVQTIVNSIDELRAIRDEPARLSLDDTIASLRAAKHRLKAMRWRSRTQKRALIYIRALLRRIDNAEYFLHTLEVPLAGNPDAENAFITETHHNGIPPEIYRKTAHFSIVYMSGAEYNPWGHVLLMLQDEQDKPVGYYHVNPFRDYPTFLTPANFTKYMANYHQEIVAIQHIPSKFSAHDDGEQSPLETVDVLKAKEALDRIVQRKWTWLGFKHNCLTFVKDVLKSGDFNCAQLGGRYRAKAARSGRGRLGGLPLPLNRLRNVKSHWLRHKVKRLAKPTYVEDEMKPHGSWVEQEFHQALLQDPIQQVYKHMSENLQKQHAFLQYVTQNIPAVIALETQHHQDQQDKTPQDIARHNILLAIEQLILNTHWGIHFGGIKLAQGDTRARVSHTMHWMLITIRDENLDEVTKLNSVMQYADNANKRHSFFRTAATKGFYSAIIRSKKMLAVAEEKDIEERLFAVDNRYKDATPV